MRWWLGVFITLFGVAWTVLRHGLPYAMNTIGAPGTVSDAGTWRADWLPWIIEALRPLDDWLRDAAPLIVTVIGLLWVLQGVWGVVRDWGRVKMFGPLRMEFPTEANLPNKMAEPYKRYSCIYAAENRAIEVYRAALSICVSNRSRVTIDDVRIQIVCGGTPMQPINVFLPLSDTTSQPSVDPGGRLLFQLGEYYFTEMHPTPPSVARPIEIVQKIGDYIRA